MSTMPPYPIGLSQPKPLFAGEFFAIDTKKGYGFFDKEGKVRHAAEDAHKIQGFAHILCTDGTQHTYCHLQPLTAAPTINA